MKSRNLASAIRSIDIKYIIIESLLIINGILVAFAINSWNEERHNKDKAENYISYLLRDLNGDAETISNYLEFEYQVLHHAAEALNILGSSEETCIDIELHSNILAILPRKTISLPTPTYKDLINTGNISLIKNHRIRDAILIYYQNLENLTSVIENNHHRIIDNIVSKGFFESNILDFNLSGSVEAFLTMDNLGLMKKQMLKVRTKSYDGTDILDQKEKRTIANLIKLRITISNVGVSFGEKSKIEAESLIELINSAY